MEPFQEHDVVVVLHDRPDLDMRAGDIGTIVHIFEVPNRAYEVEVSDKRGVTLALGALLSHEIAPMRVTTAVVPCAGFGTRLRPLTRAVPKELLPLGDRTLMDRVLEELREAGIQRIVVVTRAGKEALARHLEGERDVELVEQREPYGLADALLTAREAVGPLPFLMALPDQLLRGASSQLLARYRCEHTLSSCVTVPDDELALFPGAVGFVTDADGFVTGLLSGDEAGNRRGFGRTIFQSGFLAGIPENSQEGDFGTLFAAALQHGTHRLAHLEGRPIDVGTMPGYLRYWRDQLGWGEVW